MMLKALLSFLLCSSVLLPAIMAQATNLQMDSLLRAYAKEEMLPFLDSLLQSNTNNYTLALGALAKADIQLTRGEVQGILPLLEKAQTYADQMGDKALSSRTLNEYGLYYRLVDEPQKAIQAFLAAIDLLQEIKDQKALAGTYNSLAALLSDQKNYPDAITYQQLSLAIARALDGKLTQTITLGNIANNYAQLEQYDSTLSYAQQSQEVAKNIGDTVGIIHSQISLIDVHLQLKQMEQAKNIRKQLSKLVFNAPPALKVSVYRRLATLAKLEGDYDEAIALLQKAQAHVPPKPHSTQQRALLKNLYELHKDIGQYPTALSYLEAVQLIDDSIYTLGSRRVVENLKEKYEAALKDKTIETLAQENSIQRLRWQQTLLLMSLGLLGLFLLGLIFFNKHRQRLSSARQVQLELGQQLQRAQLNPHFIFNALNAIREVMKSQPRQEAEHYLLEFSQLMRTLLETNSEEFVTLEEELAFIRQYLSVQQLRFVVPFHYKIEADNIPLHYLVPAMITQPLIENAVEHGMKGNSDGKIRVNLRISHKDLHIQIENSLSQSSSPIPLKKERSYGLEITQKRMEYLSEKMQKPFNLLLPSAISGRMVAAFQLPLIDG